MHTLASLVAALLALSLAEAGKKTILVDADMRKSVLIGETKPSEQKQSESWESFLFPGNEDFGITPVEAQSAGLPVLAYGKGGALETVVDGKTGMFFPEQTVESLMECIEGFEEQEISWDKEAIRKHSESFSRERFLKNFSDYLISKLEKAGFIYSDKLKFNE